MMPDFFPLQHSWNIYKWITDLHCTAWAVCVRYSKARRTRTRWIPDQGLVKQHHPLLGNICCCNQSQLQIVTYHRLKSMLEIYPAYVCIQGCIVLRVLWSMRSLKDLFIFLTEIEWVSLLKGSHVIILIKSSWFFSPPVESLSPTPNNHQLVTSWIKLIGTKAI